MAFAVATSAPQQALRARAAPRAQPAPAPPTVAHPTLARCAGACTCGGTCDKAKDAKDDALGRTLQAAVAARAIAAPPSPLMVARLKYPGQTCSDERLDELHTAMKKTCSKPFSCAKGGLSCEELEARHATATLCHTERKGIEDECFGGNSDAGHKDQIRTVGNAVDTCANKISSKGC